MRCTKLILCDPLNRFATVSSGAVAPRKLSIGSHKMQFGSLKGTFHASAKRGSESGNRNFLIWGALRSFVRRIAKRSRKNPPASFSICTRISLVITRIHTAQVFSLEFCRRLFTFGFACAFPPPPSAPGLCFVPFCFSRLFKNLGGRSGTAQTQACHNLHNRAEKCGWYLTNRTRFPKSHPQSPAL